MPPHRVINPIMDRATTAVSYGTSGTVGLGGLVTSDWVMVFAAIFFAALTFAVNWWYQKRREAHERELREVERAYKAAHDLREQEYHEARMRKLLGDDEASGD